MNLGTLMKRFEEMERRVALLEQREADLQVRLGAVEQKRGPGRPPKEESNER